MSFSDYSAAHFLEKGIPPSQVIAVLGEPFRVITREPSRLEIRHPSFHNVTGFGETRLDAFLCMASRCYEMIHHEDYGFVATMGHKHSSDEEIEFAHAVSRRYAQGGSFPWAQQAGGRSGMDLRRETCRKREDSHLDLSGASVQSV